MGNLVFATDIHLNFCNENQIQDFAASILKRNPTAVVLGGDLSEAPNLEIHVRYLEKYLNGVPLYFVCGNHDYYHGSIEVTRNMLKSRFKTGGAVWLPTAGIVSLSPETALVGHDSWYDGGYPDKNGNWFASKLGMSDYHIIQELSPRFCIGHTMRFRKITALAKEGAEHIKKYVTKAFETYNKVFYVQHVSPFAETSRAPDGSMSDVDWMPHFCSRQSGEAILEVMKKMPAEKELIVLCGHSHTLAWHRPLPNVYCLCGPARYGKPKVAEQFSY